MSSKLEFQKGVEERIDAIGKEGADLQAITMFLFMHANTRERFEAVVCTRSGNEQARSHGLCSGSEASLLAGRQARVIEGRQKNGAFSNLRHD